MIDELYGFGTGSHDISGRLTRVLLLMQPTPELRGTSVFVPAAAIDVSIGVNFIGY